MTGFTKASKNFSLPKVGISTERCIGSFFRNYLLEAIEQKICWIDVSLKFAEEVQKILEEKNRADFFLSQSLDVTAKNYLQTEQLIDQTLRYLQTDYLDLVFIPKMTFSQAFSETIRILQNCVKKGKIRFLGMKHQDPAKGTLIKNSSLYRSFQLFALPSSYQEVEEFLNPNLFSILSIADFPKTLLEDPVIKEKSQKEQKPPAEIFLSDCLENNFYLLFSLFSLSQIFPQKKLRDVFFLQEAISSLKTYV
jgi:diketogulonate reductase-like aldo/keto reductase